MLAIAFAVFFAVGCSTPGTGRGGPPPATAADGYRHDYRGMTPTYDESLGLYSVGTLEGHYFQGGSFYRRHRGVWYAAPHIIGPWEPVPAGSLPVMLRGIGP